MPSFPHPGSVTICEINRDLITAESLSDDVAKDTYGKILGMVFSPLPFQSDQLVQPPSPDHDAEQVVTTSPTKGFLKNLQGIINLTPLFRPNHVNLLPEVDLQGVSWHQHKHVVALISGSNQVIIRDFEDFEGKEPCILANESQREVKVLEWRPNGGRQLAVACKGGICIWAASFPGSAASIRSGSSSFLGTLSRGSGIRYTLVDFLRTHNEEQISALSWSPDGRYLASGSYESSSFTIWDVSQGMLLSYAAPSLLQETEEEISFGKTCGWGNVLNVLFLRLENMPRFPNKDISTIVDYSSSLRNWTFGLRRNLNEAWVEESSSVLDVPENVAIHSQGLIH